jgi:hypothetical protein
MWSETAHRVSVFVLSLALATGLVAHSVPASEMGVKAAAMAGMTADMAPDMPMSGHCDGCGDDQKAVTSGACAAFCGSVVSLPLVPVIFGTISVDVLGHSAGRTLTGHADPPDPYPPRPTILS